MTRAEPAERTHPAPRAHRRWARWRRTPFGLRILYAWTAVVLVFVSVPGIMVAITSLNGSGTVAFPPRSWSFRAYGQISKALFTAGLTSVELAALAAVLSLVLGYPAALALSRTSFIGKPLLEALLRSPLTAPQVVFGVAAFQFYLTIHFGSFALNGSFLGLAIAHTAIACPFATTTLIAAMLKLDHNVEDAARGLGASSLRATVGITIPTLKPALFSAAFFCFLLSFDNVPVSLFLVPASSPTLPVSLYFSTTFALEPNVFAAATLVVLLAVLATVAWNRFVGFRSLGGQA